MEDVDWVVVDGCPLETALLKSAGKSRMLLRRSAFRLKSRAFRRAERTVLFASLDFRYFSANAVARDSTAGKASLRVRDWAVIAGSSSERCDRDDAAEVIDLCDRFARA